jgi:hypothetical protein
MTSVTFNSNLEFHFGKHVLPASIGTSVIGIRSRDSRVCTKEKNQGVFCHGLETPAGVPANQSVFVYNQDR